MFWIYEIIDKRYFSISPKNSLPDAKEVADKLSKRAKDRGYNHTFVVKKNGNPEILYSTEKINE
jgi:hypothetical protein